VALQLDSLEKCLNWPSLSKALGSLPKTLKQTYGNMIAAIDEDYRDLAIQSLTMDYLSWPTFIHQTSMKISIDPVFTCLFQLHPGASLILYRWQR